MEEIIVDNWYYKKERKKERVPYTRVIKCKKKLAGKRQRINEKKREKLAKEEMK